MKRFAIPTIALAIALGTMIQLATAPKSVQVAGAQDLSGVNLWQTHFLGRRLTMRNTSAASVARNPLWTARENSSGFADSTVFRRGATTATAYDTTIGYDTSDFPLPPHIGPASAAPGDTSGLWLILRVSQDSVATGPYVFTGTSGLDSVRIAAEYSYDGTNWFSCSGTPTRRFDVVYMTSGQDGLQNVTLIGVENSPGEDAALVSLCAVPSLVSSNSFTINRTLAFAGTYVRFIIGEDASGQFKVEALTWAHH